jgi:UTP--glucose-1-phosphate uridylyltransferase
MIDVYEQTGGGVFACKRVTEDSEYTSYGFAAGDAVSEGLLRMREIVEKPGKQNAPSQLASVSGYLLPGSILSYIEKGLESHSEGEFTFQPFVQQMIDEGHDFYAKEIQNAQFYDTGNPLEYLKTTIDFGLAHPEFGDSLRDYLKRKL